MGKDSASNSGLIASINGKFLRNSWSVSSFGTSVSSPTSSMNRSPFRPLRHSSANRIRADSLRRSMSWQSLNHDDLDKVSVCSNNETEDDSISLHKKVEQLKDHLEQLMEKQAAMDKRYNKVKDDNNNLVAKVHILEDQVSEVKIRGEERLKEETKRLKREMMMEIENYSIRSEGLERVKDSLQVEVLNLKSELEKARGKGMRMENKLFETQRLLSIKNEEKGVQFEDEFVMKEKMMENRKNLSRNDSGMQVCDEVFEDHPVNARIQELELEIVVLKEKNINLIENFEEMQAKMLTRDLKEGKSLVNLIGQEKASSLADEFETMTQEKMKRKMHEQKLRICQLNNYIENALLRIMEKDPQILEVMKM